MSSWGLDGWLGWGISGLLLAYDSLLPFHDDSLLRRSLLDSRFFRSGLLESLHLFDGGWPDDDLSGGNLPPDSCLFHHLAVCNGGTLGRGLLYGGLLRCGGLPLCGDCLLLRLAGGQSLCADIGEDLSSANPSFDGFLLFLDYHPALRDGCSKRGRPSGLTMCGRRGGLRLSSGVRDSGSDALVRVPVSLDRPCGIRCVPGGRLLGLWPLERIIHFPRR